MKRALITGITGQDLSYPAQLIARMTGFEEQITKDPTKPDGTIRKLMEVGRLSKMGWRAQIELKQGLRYTYDWYLANTETART